MDVSDYKEWLSAQLVSIRKSKDQLRANLNATEGAEQFCQQALAKLDEQKEQHGSE